MFRESTWKLAANGSTIFYRDFAHAPSKVKATIEAVKNQFPDKKFIAVLELHTYSSLNETFIKEYKGAMDSADEASVFYSKHALELKRMPDLAKETVKNGFATTCVLVIAFKALNIPHTPKASAPRVIAVLPMPVVVFCNAEKP